MSSPHPPAGGPVGRLPGESLGDSAAPPAEINGTSRDRDSVDAPERTTDVETSSRNRAEQVRAQAAARAAQLRGQAMEKAPQVRAQAAANRGKAVAALAFVVLVLWLRRRRSRRSSGTADGLAGGLDQQARSLVGDTVDALSSEAGSAGRGRDKAQKTRARAAATAQAIEKAQQAREQAIEKAQQLRAQAREKAQAAEMAQQAAQEAQELVQALRKRLPRRVTRTG
jgi:hypothetical protein